MNGSAGLLVVGLFAMSCLANGRTIDISEVPPGPSTYKIGKHLPGGFSVFENRQIAPNNISELLPAGEFTFGNLTRNSLVVAS